MQLFVAHRDILETLHGVRGNLNTEDATPPPERQRWSEAVLLCGWLGGGKRIHPNSPSFRGDCGVHGSLLSRGQGQGPVHSPVAGWVGGEQRASDTISRRPWAGLRLSACVWAAALRREAGGERLAGVWSKGPGPPGVWALPSSLADRGLQRRWPQVPIPGPGPLPPLSQGVTGQGSSGIRDFWRS